MKYLNIILVFVSVIILINGYTCFNVYSESFESNNDKCVIYNYYEKDELYKSNFIYFLKNGILNDIDYYIVINGETSVNIPTNHSNIFIFKRKNIGFDFGAYSYIINNHLKREYNYYFFINSSVKGPYLKDNTIKWYIPFLKLFNDETPLVGTSINIFTNESFYNINLKNLYGEKPYTHIQSMFLAMKSSFLYYLINNNFFNEDEINKLNKDEVIAYKEIGMSQLALRNNYNINCILSKYKNKDYRIITKDFNNSSVGGDPYYINGYFNDTIDPYEVIFFKNNRW